MPLPLEARTIVPCIRCGYVYPWRELDDARVCLDRAKCDGNLARQSRYLRIKRRNVHA
jgi:hypothetical protein